MKFQYSIEGTDKSALETARLRLMVGAALFAAGFLAISVRLVDLAVLQQGPDGPRIAARNVAAPNYMARANIVDRNGMLLATNLETASLFAEPHRIIDPVDAATALVGVLPNLEVSEVAAKLATDSGFVWIKRGLTPTQVFAVNRLGIPGFNFQTEQRRIYPNGALTAHAVGFAGIDNEGLSGIEQSMDASLTSRRGSTERPSAAPTVTTLSIDLRIQQIVREELLAQIERFSALGGGGIVLDANNGEVLAMVSLPDFDPNQIGLANDDQIFNRMAYGVYELGSVFKIFTLAMALESGAANFNSLYDATEPIRISRFTIRDFKPQSRVLSLREVFRYSSNIGAAKIGLDIGGETQRAYLSELGLFERTGIELPEQGTPIFPDIWRDINTMTISYGHGIAVTPLHLVSAVAAVVNGGEYRPPTILIRPEGDRAPSRRVFSQRTSAQMRALMRMVVTEGTGGKAAAPGYLVGGKTGTAEKNAHGTYSEARLLTSFVAAFPIDDPNYIVMIMLDEPHGIEESYGYATAGWTAAPVVSRVISRMAPVLGILPVEETEDPRTTPNGGSNDERRPTSNERIRSVLIAAPVQHLAAH